MSQEQHVGLSWQPDKIGSYREVSWTLQDISLRCGGHTQMVEEPVVWILFGLVRLWHNDWKGSSCKKEDRNIYVIHLLLFRFQLCYKEFEIGQKPI